MGGREGNLRAAIVRMSAPGIHRTPRGRVATGLALGSNMGGCESNLRTAVERMSAAGIHRTPRGRVATGLAFDYFRVKRKPADSEQPGLFLSEDRILIAGSNHGNREGNLRTAIERISAAGIRALRESPIYETEPVGYTDQRWFLNMVVEAETALFPMQLLTRTDKIERALGRVRTVPNGPRTIDIDILLYGSAVVRTSRLEIPHPRMYHADSCWRRWPISCRTCTIRCSIEPSASCWKPRRLKKCG